MAAPSRRGTGLVVRLLLIVVILAAVAVVVFVGYQTLGTTIQSLLTTVDSSL